MADTLEFVDKIDASPTVRLDLNDDTKWGNTYDSDFPPPPLRRSVVSTLLTDGERIPASAYGNRLLKMVLELKTPTIEDSATEIQKLNRELDRETNTIRWKPGTTAPVFFRTLRSSSSSIREIPGQGNFRTFSVEVLAEPFAIGLREDPTIDVVRRHDPEHANGAWIDINSVKGDVDTPALVLVRGPDSEARQIALGTRAGGTPSALLAWTQAETGSYGADTSTVAVVTASAGNVARTTFATSAAMVDRITALSLTRNTGGASIEQVGTYRIFARLVRSAATTFVKLRVIHETSLVVLSETTPWPSTDTTTTEVIADLGLIQVPRLFPDPIVGYSGTPLSFGNPAYKIAIQRTAGAGTLDVDYFFAVPADRELCIVDRNPAQQSTTKVLVLDGALDKIYLTSNTGALSGAGLMSNALQDEFTPTRVGSIPKLRPGTNRLFVTPVGFSPGAIINENRFGVSYWPRYLYVRPAST